jgi:hypothetical protein
MPLEVCWGKERHSVDVDIQHGTLGNLQLLMHQLTEVPVESMKLLFNGGMYTIQFTIITTKYPTFKAVMKDVKLPLAAYGIKEDSRLTMMGTRPADIQPPAPQGQQQSSPKAAGQPGGKTAKIDSVLSTDLPPILQRLQRFESFISSQTNADGGSKQSIGQLRQSLFADLEQTLLPVQIESVKPQQQQEQPYSAEFAYREISEYLLRLLMRFDEISCGDDDELRSYRKGSVKRIQRLQEYVDFLRSRKQVTTNK